MLALRVQCLTQNGMSYISSLKDRIEFELYSSLVDASITVFTEKDNLAERLVCQFSLGQHAIYFRPCGQGESDLFWRCGKLSIVNSCM